MVGAKHFQIPSMTEKARPLGPIRWNFLADWTHNLSFLPDLMGQVDDITGEMVQQMTWSHFM